MWREKKHPHTIITFYFLVFNGETDRQDAFNLQSGLTEQRILRLALALRIFLWGNQKKKPISNSLKYWRGYKKNKQLSP